jgi:predicted dehydrogenase
MDPVRIGLIGCGAVSGAYLAHTRAFPILQFAACSDIDVERANAKAMEFGIARVLSVDEMLRDSKADIILNLTVPRGTPRFPWLR